MVFVSMKTTDGSGSSKSYSKTMGLSIHAWQCYIKNTYILKNLACVGMLVQNFTAISQESSSGEMFCFNLIFVLIFYYYYYFLHIFFSFFLGFVMVFV